MNAKEIPTAEGMALAWLNCGSVRNSRAGTAAASVTVLRALNSAEPGRYFRRAANPGRAMDMGNSSGTRFASLSASSYST